MSAPVQMDSAPRRIQLSRAKGWRMPANTIKVDRSTKWGNPIAIGAEASIEAVDGKCYALIIGRHAAVDLFRQLAVAKLARNPDEYLTLRGKNLACWCAPDEPCHADVLLDLANK